MIFTTEQISNILRTIQFQYISFISENIGVGILSEEERSLLKDFGIDVETISKVHRWTPIDQSFHLGRLVQILGQKNISKLTYNDFLKYLQKGQFIPLSSFEKYALKYSKQKTYSYLKKLEVQSTSDVSTILYDSERLTREKYEGIISRSVSRAIKERDSVTSIVSEIGTRTQDWQRNLLRIAETELQSCFQQGICQQILRESGPKATVFKEVYPGACKYCIKFYLTDGIGSQPREFKLSDLIANGSNIGRKQADWLPVVDATHPFCRCNLLKLEDNYEWDEEAEKYRLKKIESKIRVKSKIKIWVNDKYFEV